MKILRLYLFRRLLYGFTLSLLVLLSIETFLSITAESEDLNIGNYSFYIMMKYIIYTIPKSIFELFPYAILIGTMLSLGTMAADREFIAIHNSGISVKRIIEIILIQVFFLSLIFYILCDFIVPKYTQHAEFVKNSAINKTLIHNPNGTWFKDENKFITVKQIYSRNKLENITIYHYDDAYKLLKTEVVKEANFSQNQWKLTHITETNLLTKPIQVKFYDEQIKTKFIDQKLIRIRVSDPVNISFFDVLNNLHYLENNNLDDTEQKMIFWEKLFKPFSTIIMLFLAMPFLFGKYRDATLGKRIVVGLFIGIIFFVVSSILPDLANVIGFFPFINILLPNALFIMLGIYLYRRQLESGLQ